MHQDKEKRDMKNIIFTLALITATCALYAQQPDEQLRKHFAKCYFTDTCNTVLPYRLLSPLNVDSTKKYPVVLFLHGAGERGNDNEAQLTYMDKIFGSNSFRQKYPCYVILPQCAEEYRWCDTISVYLNAANQLLDSIVNAVNADTSRLYITGMSMGGFGTWDLISCYPNKFAAAVPICGGADLNMACILKDMPIKTYHGSTDKLVKVTRTRNMTIAIHKCGGNKIDYTELTGKGHLIWNYVYNQPSTFQWMFAQKKKK